jgi:hypothetical protein
VSLAHAATIHDTGLSSSGHFLSLILQVAPGRNGKYRKKTTFNAKRVEPIGFRL